MTTSRNKYREIRALLAPFGIRLRWSRQVLPEPQADRLQDVVRAKLDSARGAGWVLVEDSGIFVRALGGFPGVYSSYVHRTIGLGGVLRLLNGRSRAAVFRTVAGLRHEKACYLFAGRSLGRIASRPAGKGGFGYDPIFIPNGWSQTFAQRSVAQKGAVSHRGQAMRSVGRFLVRAGIGTKHEP